MEVHDLVVILFRWLHILAAIAAAGGAIFNRVALLPAAKDLPEDTRKALLANVRRRWSKVLMTAIGLLILSGFYNFWAGALKSAPPVDAYKGLYHGLFGLKFLLAMGVFFLASLLSGRSEAADRFRAAGTKWHTVTLTLVIIIVCISGVLRWIPRVSAPMAVAIPAQANP